MLSIKRTNEHTKRKTNKQNKRSAGMRVVCACVCVCVLGGERSWVFASTALVVVWTAMYLTGYTDYLTGFREPLSGESFSIRFEKMSARSLDEVLLFCAPNLNSILKSANVLRPVWLTGCKLQLLRVNCPILWSTIGHWRMIVCRQYRAVSMHQHMKT